MLRALYSRVADHDNWYAYEISVWEKINWQSLFILISSMKKVDHDGRLEIWYNWLPQEYASVYQITHHGLESSSRASINSFSTNWRLDFDISSSNEIDLSNSVDIMINQEWDEREVKVNVIMLEYEEETRSYFTTYSENHSTEILRKIFIFHRQSYRAKSIFI